MLYTSRRLPFHLRHLQRKLSTSAYTSRNTVHFLPGIALSAGAVTAYLLYSDSRVYNDAPSPVSRKEKPQGSFGTDFCDAQFLRTIVWGSNRSNTLISEPVDEACLPSVAQWLDGVALRDLAFHEDHAACVDAHGNVYQWGSKFSGKDDEKRVKSTLTLRDKNINQLQLTEGRIYALSASGKVYAVSAEAEKQRSQPGSPATSSHGWWSTGWFSGASAVDFVEITPKEHLDWGEKFTSIEAGDSHLLALTSKGRVFAHPINKKANDHSQLGFRKFQITDPSVRHQTGATQCLNVELIPNAVSDPYAKKTRSVRPSSTATSSNLVNVNDDDIRFCTHLFEIPILRGIEMAQVAAGARSSFARTVNGRVLSWGANEHGQLGLGNNVVIEAVEVPTEVVLWRPGAVHTTSRCLDISAGGDLTAFTVERVDGPSTQVVDLLMCGNGQWGGLGNNIFSTAQSTPSRVKEVSGRLEYNDKTRKPRAITPDSVSISPTGHVFLTLNTDLGTDNSGKDIYVWGKNYNYELGNGKKSSVAVPVNLETADGSRLALRRQKADVVDLQGKNWKRGVRVEQRAVTGFRNGAIYWRITS